MQKLHFSHPGFEPKTCPLREQAANQLSQSEVLSAYGLLNLIVSIQARAIRLIDAVASDAISLAQLNIDADSVTPARRPFRQRYWARNQRPTTRIDGEGRRLSFDT